MKTKLFNSSLILPIPPIFFALASWWTTIPFLEEGYIKYLILIGFVIGVLIDIFIYKKYLSQELSTYVLLLAYIFYMICVFGFFMGVPVFNIFVCIPFAIYMFNYQKDYGRKFTLISTISMFFICFASAFLALRSSSTLNDLNGMLRTDGYITSTILYLIIGVGGAGLIVTNFFLAKYSGRIYKKLFMKA